MMYVVGATRAEQLSEIREIIPNHFLLIPGVGAQGGNLQNVAKYGINAEAGHLQEKGINVISNGDGTYSANAGVDFQKLEHEKNKLTRSIKKHVK